MLRIKIKCSKTIPCKSCVVSTHFILPPPSHLFPSSLRFRVPCTSAVTKPVIIFSERRNCAGLCPNGARLARGMFLWLIVGPQARTSRRKARGQRACHMPAVIHLNDSPRAVLDATTHLHEQIAAIREHRRALQTALAQVHGARSSEPHTKKPPVATTWFGSRPLSLIFVVPYT
jgi:hypothetical protein